MEQGFWGAVLKGLVKKVAKLWIFVNFFCVAGEGGGWCDFGGAVGLSSRGCVLVRAGVSLRSRGCVLEVVWVWCWGSWKYVRVALKYLGVMP